MLEAIPYYISKKLGTFWQCFLFLLKIVLNKLAEVNKR